MLSTATEAVKVRFTTPDFSVLGMKQVWQTVQPIKMEEWKRCLAVYTLKMQE